MTTGQAHSASRGIVTTTRFVSIRLIVTAVAVALVAGGVLGVGWVGEHQLRTVLTTEIESRLLLTARNLARLSSGALLSEFPELVLNPVVREIQQDHEELAFLVVVDHENRIQGHTDVRNLDTSFHVAENLVEIPVRLRLAPGEEVRGNESILMVSTPVQHPSGAAIGMVHVGLRRNHLESAATAARQQQGMVLMLLLLLSVASTLILMTVLLRPIGRLREGLERIGRGNLNDPIELQDRTEFQLLAESINSMAGELRRAQEQMMEKERLKHEMELARQIQSSLLPAHSVIAEDFEILGVHQAAAEVGGDYFDVLELPDGRLGIAIADVSGKGLAGCLVMSMVAVLLRSLRRSHRTPSALLGALDDQLAGNLRPGVFVTMFYGILDPKTGQLCFASAGHSPLLVSRATGELEWHYTEAIPIGAVKGALRETLRDYELHLAHGDTLVQFTDGVNEAWEPKDREQFGFERLEEVVRKAAPLGSRAVVTAVRQALTEWTGDLPRMDDETLVVVHRLPSGNGDSPASEKSRAARGGLLPGAAEVLAERAWSQRDAGAFLRLRVDPTDLPLLRDWLHRCPQLGTLPPAEAVLLEHALHELCANIIEHGHRGRHPSETRDGIDLWWLPEADLWREETLRDPARFDGNLALQQVLRRGVFLVRDRGQAFSPTSRHQADLENLAVRKRGRGLGLRIIQEIMHPLFYLAGVAQGNLTLMRFDPVRSGSLKEVRHVSSKSSSR